MRVICRIPPTVLVLSWLVVSAGGALASIDGATPAHPAKTVKQCNQELEKNAAALEAAGESASAFFHRCWFHSEQGKPTPIAHDEAVPSPAGDKAAAKRTVGADEAPADRRETVRRRVSRRRPPSEPREAAVPRRRLNVEADFSDVVTAPVNAPTIITLPAPVVLGTLSHAEVNVPAVGSVAVPILPGMEGMVRTVVEHPVVPGLITMPP